MYKVEKLIIVLFHSWSQISYFDPRHRAYRFPLVKYYSWRQNVLRGRRGSLKREFWLACSSVKIQISYWMMQTNNLALFVAMGGVMDGAKAVCCGFFLHAEQCHRQKISRSFDGDFYSAGEISQSCQESRVKTRNWKHARINKTNQNRQPINQSTVVTHSKSKWTLWPVVDWLTGCLFWFRVMLAF